MNSRLLPVSVILLVMPHFGAAQSASEPWLPVGTEIVLKDCDTPLRDQGWLSPSPEQITFVIEAVEGERLLVVSPDKSRHGWLRRDQVVPLDRSIAYFSREIARSPSNGDAYWMRGRLRAYQAEDNLAIADLDQAIQLKPDQARFYVRRSRLLIRSRQLDRALADCDRAIERDPQSTEAFVLRSSIWLSKGDSQRARADLDEAIRLDPIKPPDNPVSPDGRRRQSLDPNVPPAQAAQPPPSRGAGREEQPADDENPANQPELESAPDLVDRGLTWLERQEYNKAIADFTSAIRLDPQSDQAYAGRAQAWARKHYRDREAADYTEAIRLAPRKVGYRVSRAISWSAQGRHDQAIADYDDAIRLEPDNPTLYVARGNEWRRHLKLDTALTDYHRAIQLDPNYIHAYICCALITKQRRAFDKAVLELSELVRMAPENAEVHRTLARILATCNNDAVRDGNRAVREAARACELTAWRDPDCLDTLAAACAEAGDFPAAVQWQTQALMLLRQNVPSALRRAMDFGGRRGVGFEDRLAFYKRKRPCRE
jgi:tetratricopeptide (TPR) repeat protein